MYNVTNLLVCMLCFHPRLNDVYVPMLYVMLLLFMMMATCCDFPGGWVVISAAQDATLASLVFNSVGSDDDGVRKRLSPS